VNAAQCRAARALLNWTVKHLAKEAMVSTSTVVILENGGELKPRTVAAIRAALEVAGVEFIVGGVKLKSSEGETP
jgi:transcriptional regulator with XRE-family HTH domain